MEIIALVNVKGGVGKTTTTVNAAHALARSGRQVLVVDFDPSSSGATDYTALCDEIIDRTGGCA